MKKVLTFLTVLIIGGLIISGCGATQNYQGMSEVPTINVNGTGTIITQPDLVQIGVNVVTEGEGKDVQGKNAEKAEKVINGLLDLGLDKKEIETVNVSFNPIKQWTEKEGETIKGYRAENSLLIKTKKIDLAGQIIDTAVKLDAQKVGNITFSLSDEGKEELLEKAIDAAIADARKQADAAAKSAGVTIAGVKNIEIYQNDNNYPVYLRKVESAAAAEDLMVTTPINPKDTEYEVRVKAAFLINN